MPPCERNSWFSLRHHQRPVDAGDLLAHREDAVLHIQVIPPERQQLPLPRAAGQLQEEHGQDAALLRLTEIYSPSFSSRMIAISFFSLGGIRQLSQGL